MAAHKTPPAFAKARFGRLVTTKSLVHTPDLAAEKQYVKERRPTWGSPLALLIFSDKKNSEPARRMLPRRPNVDKPKQDNAGDQHHPKLHVSIQQRNVGDQPLSHLASPP